MFLAGLAIAVALSLFAAVLFRQRKRAQLETRRAELEAEYVDLLIMMQSRGRTKDWNRMVDVGNTLSRLRDSAKYGDDDGYSLAAHYQAKFETSGSFARSTKIRKRYEYAALRDLKELRELAQQLERGVWPRSVRIQLPPGTRFLGAVRSFFGKKITERVFEQAIADMREEWLEAIVADKKRLAIWIQVRGYFGLAMAVCLQSGVNLAKRVVQIWKAN